MFVALRPMPLGDLLMAVGPLSAGVLLWLNARLTYGPIRW